DLDALVLGLEPGHRLVHDGLLGAAARLVEQPDPQGAGAFVGGGCVLVNLRRAARREQRAEGGDGEGFPGAHGSLRCSVCNSGSAVSNRMLWTATPKGKV